MLHEMLPQVTATMIHMAQSQMNDTTNADMSPDEFGAWLSKDGNQAKFRKLAGG